MSEVIIKIDTGFSGATHEEYTHLTVEEWKALSKSERNEWINEAISEVISAYAEDEDGNTID